MAAAVLILSAATAFRDLKLLETKWFLPLTAAGLFLAVSGIYVLQSLAPLEELNPCAAAAVLVGLAVWYYQPLLWPGRERLEPDSLLFLTGSILLALTDLELLGISVGRALLCVLLLYTAYQRGTMAGVAAGLGTGLTVDFLTGEGGVLFGAAYGLAGLLAGSRSGRRRGTAALAFLGAVLAALLPAKNALAVPLLLEAAVGTALFLLLPGRAFGGKRVKRAEAAESSGPAPLERMKAQLTRTAAALRDLYDSMGRGLRSPPTRTRPSSLTGRRRRCAGAVPCASSAGKRSTPAPSTPSTTPPPSCWSGAGHCPRTFPATLRTGVSICRIFSPLSTGS